ncbi:hypothetical protein PQ472_07855 [Lacticaseibacillus pabuli]|uniref:Uncharacterized protein n=1 Tax=Lacticaseibacillus pabuli TaxID=3025672 RepID=A0ABY7WNV1_9LACO|nr:hypothetical protein [Lacticaseibacillus sp. KACC 23028]WDF81839.1 hypothetical protein PQ472_07855 [Lacticaseibacillus sp. KACC 23028]
MTKDEHANEIRYLYRDLGEDLAQLNMTHDKDEFNRGFMWGLNVTRLALRVLLNGWEDD